MTIDQMRAVVREHDELVALRDCLQKLQQMMRADGGKGVNAVLDRYFGSLASDVPEFVRSRVAEAVWETVAGLISGADAKAQILRNQHA